MAKYKFIKEYVATITVGGVVGVTRKTYNVGDVVEGEPSFVMNKPHIEVRLRPHSVFDDQPASNMSSSEFILIPAEYLTEAGMASIVPDSVIPEGANKKKFLIIASIIAALLIAISIFIYIKLKK